MTVVAADLQKEAGKVNREESRVEGAAGRRVKPHPSSQHSAVH